MNFKEKLYKHYLNIGIDISNNFTSWNFKTLFLCIFISILFVFTGYAATCGIFSTDDPGTRVVLIITSTYIYVIEFRVISLIWTRKDLDKIMEWIMQRYAPRINSIVGNNAQVQFGLLNQNLLKWAKVYFWICLVSTLFMILMPLMVPSIDFAIPFEIPFIPSKGWPYFHINYGLQTIFLLFAVYFINLYLGTFIFIMTHVLLELDLVLELCKKIGIYEESLFDFEKNLYDFEMFQAGKLQECPNLSQMPINHERFDKLFSSIVHMHNDVTRIISKISVFFSINMFIWEMMIVCGYCKSFTIIVWYRELAHFIPMDQVIYFHYFIICFLSLKMSEKYENIGNEIYLSKWYYLTKHQKRSLLIVMMKARQTSTLTSAGVADMDLERFTSVSKGCYNLCLFLGKFM
uniref:Odorant receptor n=1 Tax=Culicoides sonorensis TaxID=179676 RepID=A0A336M5T9_CULSO